MSLVSLLYKIARVANNANAVTHPKRARRRMKNILVGRALGKIGFWRWLWK